MRVQTARNLQVSLLGALTSKVYAFEYRSWELTTHTSLDCTDNLGTRIRVQKKGKKILRVLPLSYSEVNFDWISDKARYIFEGTRNFRLLQTYIRGPKKHHAIQKRNKLKAVPVLVQKLLEVHAQLTLVCGKNLNLRSLGLAKYKFFQRLVPSLQVVSETNRYLPANLPFSYQSTAMLPQVNESDSCLAIGINPRRESTLLNLRLRYRQFQGNFDFVGFGSSIDLTYASKNPGPDGSQLQFFLEGLKNSTLLKKKKPLILFGDTLCRRQDGSSLFFLSLLVQKHLSLPSWFASFYLSPETNSLGKASLGFQNWKSPSATLVLGGEQTDFLSKIYPNFPIFYTGTHRYENSLKADLLFPLPIHWDEKGEYMTCTGEVYLNNKELGSDNRDKYALYALDFVSPKNQSFRWAQERLTQGTKLPSLIVAAVGKTGLKNLLSTPFFAKVWKTLLKPVVGDPFCTDNLSKASPTLYKLSLNSRASFWSFRL
jgi:hypothetical protein